MKRSLKKHRLKNINRKVQKENYTERIMWKEFHGGKYTEKHTRKNIHG